MTTTVLPHVNYLNVRYGLASWLLTKDHKRIGIMYLVVVTNAFFLGGIFASMIRLELATPAGDLVSADTYNKMFTMHGVAMVFFVLVPAVPAILGNFALPLMLGAKDVAFPKLNLLSWYVFVIGFLFTIYAMVSGGVDTGWTFYTPYSSRASNTNVMMTGLGVSVAGALLGVGQAGQDLMGMVAKVSFELPNSREHETEADRIGVELAARAGYDPRAAVSLWNKMASQSAGAPPQWLSTHPSHANRLRDLNDYAARVMPLYEQARR